MSDFTLRQSPTAECLSDLQPLLNYAFRATPISPPPPPEVKERYGRAVEGTDSFIVYDGTKAVAAACNLPLTHNVRGKIFPACGVWGVACDPAYRRDGHARRAVHALLAAARDSGATFSALYAFRESFYERLGYVMFPEPRKFTVKPADLGSLLSLDLPGHVERTHIYYGWDTYRAYLHTLLPHIHGMAVRTTPSEFLQAFPDTWLALARINGDVRGLMLYKNEGREGDLTMQVYCFYSSELAARYLLLNWIARHVDQVGEASLRVLATDTPETWWPDLEVKYKNSFAPLGRVLDVQRLNGLPCGPGAFTARLSDPFCPWNEGTFRFAGEDGALAITPADTPECDLSIQGLTALVYGTHAPDLFSFRGWGNPTPDVQAAMRAMLTAQTPHLHAAF